MSTGLRPPCIIPPRLAGRPAGRLRAKGSAHRRMEMTGFRVYRYRWIVLLAFMGVVVVNQILSITFAFAMDGLKNQETGSMTVPLAALIALMGLGVLLCTRLRESALIRGDAAR